MSERSFIEIWSLAFDDVALIAGFSRPSRVWVAFQLRFFHEHARFPSREGDVAADSLRYLAEQLGLPVPDHGDFHFGHVNARRQRGAILRHYGIRRASDRDKAELRAWLSGACRQFPGSIEDQMELGYQHCRERGFFVPSDKIMERLVRGARHDAVEGLLGVIAGRLSGEVKARLDACLADPKGATGFLSLKADVGAASLANILAACDRLAFIEGLDLPTDLPAGIDAALVGQLSRRVEHETAAEMRRHGDIRRRGLLALYLMQRKARIIDDLVDLLLEIVHRLQTRSRRRVVGAIARDIERVHGKERLLVDIAVAATDDPDGRVVDVIYPIADAAKLRAVIEEHRARGTLDRRVQTVMRGSYASHSGECCPGCCRCWIFVRIMPAGGRSWMRLH